MQAIRAGRRSRAARATGALVLVMVAVAALWSSPASAHTDFESSDPADGQTVDGPIDAVTVSFTNPATPVGGGSGAALDELLDAEASDDGVWSGRFGRAMTFGGTTFAIGVLVAAAMVVRGSREELGTLLAWVRLAGLVVFAWAAVALGTHVDAGLVELSDVASVSAGVAVLLKAMGGVALYFSVRGRAAHLEPVGRPLSAGAADTVPGRSGGSRGDGGSSHPLVRWTPGRSLWIAMAGCAAILISFWFDGHTVLEGFRPLRAAVNLVHVAAAAVWVGGVFAMATIAWRRRRGPSTDLAAMVVRFSPIAATSLAAVASAGVVMAIMILDSPSGLWDTSWGRVLLIKVGAVAAAASVGAFNHFRLRPALERSPDDVHIARRLRGYLGLEALAMVTIVTITAWLVASATI